MSPSHEERPLLNGHGANNSYDSISSVGSSQTDPSTLAVTPQKPLNKVSRKDLAWILLAIWSAVFLGALDGTIVATLLSPIGSYFDKSHQASYVGTSYLLSVCCFTPLYGRLSDIIGRKYAMLLALLLFGIGTVMCGFAPSMEFLIAARAVAGMGGGGVMTVSSIIGTDLIPLKNRGLLQGFANILFGLGAGLGGPLGGWINDAFGWRFAFLVQIPILVFSMIMVAIKVNITLPTAATPQTTREKLNRIDWMGSLTLVLSVGGLLLGVSLKSSEDLPWSHPIVLSLLVTSAVFTVAFVWVEANWSPVPVMPMRLLSQRTPAAVAVSNLLISVAGFSMLYNVPMYFSAVRLSSSTDAGLHLLPNSFALSVGSVVAGWLMRHTGKFWLLTVCSAFAALLSSAAISTWNDGTPAFHLWFDIVPSGVGISAVITSTLIAIIAAVDREDLAVATGITYLFRTTGQVLGVSLSGALVQAILLRKLRETIVGPGAAEIIQRIRHSTSVISTLEPHLKKAAIDAYASALHAVFVAQAAVAFLAFLSCIPIEENPLPGSHEEQEEYDRKRRERRSGTVTPA